VSFDIVPIHLAVKAMRDSGYRNAAYAIAELIDNGIQAKARNIELLCREREELVVARQRRRIHEVAVLDNGTGMSRKVLREALQFGNGQHLNDRGGIGRFGMGLPNSSLSQSRRVDVWTWQKGSSAAIHSYLDLNEIESGSMREVPDPDDAPIPSVWADACKGLGSSGTLVVWSNLDRCQWRTAQAIIRNSELTIGRIYRRFISRGEVSIRLAAFVDQPSRGFGIDEPAKANDPMYLMKETSCAPPWNSEAMFEAYGSPTEFEVSVGHERHIVRVSFSVAKREARQGHSPGSKDHGKHAGGNVGVSVVRADRELELQAGWNIHYDPVERWWGAEVEIPPALDEVFGVTNDKQSARALADVALVDGEHIALREGYSSVHELEDAWRADNDPRLILLRVKQHIETNLAQIRKGLEAQTRGPRQGTRRHTVNSAEERGTDATRQRQAQGHVGSSDAGETKPAAERAKEIAGELAESGMDAGAANERGVEIVRDGRKFEFIHVDLETSAFFSVRPRGGTILIQLNTTHPAYRHLIALLEDDLDAADVEQLRGRMRKSYDGLKLLLEAWARYEDELPATKKDQARDARADWGRVAREFLRDD
jgi:hypothetical protein